VAKVTFFIVLASLLLADTELFIFVFFFMAENAHFFSVEISEEITDFFQPVNVESQHDDCCCCCCYTRLTASFPGQPG